MIIVTASEMQTMDRRTIEKFGIPGQVLMENAGRGAVRSFLQRLYHNGKGRVGVIAGRGNNGGDGFVIARYLAQNNIAVSVYLLAQKQRVQGDAAANLRLLDELKVPVIEILNQEQFNQHHSSMRHMRYWIDAILGTGLKADIKGYFHHVIIWLNQQQRPVFAVDIPSGLNADTGQPCGICVRAAATATFAFAKSGHLIHPGADLCGSVDIVDIGIPPFVANQVAPRQHLITPDYVCAALGQRPADTHKGRTGHVLVVAGSTGKTGAAAMTAASALRVGAGLVTVAVPSTLNAIIESQATEAMTLPLPDNNSGRLTEDAFDAIVAAAENKKCLALGPGMGTAETSRKLMQRIVKEMDIALVIDADGLNNLVGDLSCLKRKRSEIVLTPHPGEMARLTGWSVSRIQQDRIAAARSLAEQYQVHVVLKGARTVTGHPDGWIGINPTGNAGMASGGMGDVLTGMIAGLIAQGCPADKAAQAGVYLHGLAADQLQHSIGPQGYLATEVMQTIPSAIDRVCTDPPPLPVQLLAI